MSQSRIRRPGRPADYWPEILRMAPAAWYDEDGTRYDVTWASELPPGQTYHQRTMTRAELIERYGFDPVIRVNWFDEVRNLPRDWVERARFLENHRHLLLPALYSAPAPHNHP